MEFKCWFNNYFNSKIIPYCKFVKNNGEIIDINELIDLIKYSSNIERTMIKDMIQIIESNNGNIIEFLKDLAKLVEKN